MILTKNQKIGVGVAAGTLALILVGLGVYFGFIKKDTTKKDTTNPPRCANADRCNAVLEEWIVKKNWKFDNSAKGGFTECAGCKNISFMLEGATPKTSNDGGVTWTAHKDHITAYNKVKQ